MSKELNVYKIEQICESIVTGKLDANKKNDNGKYLFFTCDEKPSRINEYAFDKRAIIISGNGSKVGHINFYEGKFNAYQRTYVLSDFTEKIYDKYLFYYLKAKLRKYISLESRKGSIPYITMPMIKSFKIIAPSLEKQKEIVQILDKFSMLEAELEAREKQYHYYRNYLLDSKNIENLLQKISLHNWSKKQFSLSEIFCAERGERLIKSQRLEGKIPFVTAGYLNEGISEHISNKMKIFENAITIDMFGNCFWRPYKFSCDDNIICLSANFLTSETAHFFLASIIKTMKNYDFSKQYRLKELEKQFIEIPVIEDKFNLSLIKNISKYLQKFEIVTNSINEGLPAEIDLRKHQYEYYLNKLLDLGNKLERERERELTSLSEIFDYIQPNKYIVENKNLLPNGKTPVLTANKSFILGYTNENFGIYNCSIEKPSIIFDDFTSSIQWVDFPFKVKSSALKILQVKDEAKYNIRYLYYVLQKLDFKKDDFSHERLWISKYSKQLIEIPPIEIQDYVVSLLDKLEEISQSFEKGLPSEINLRQLQYQNYLQKLLDFNKLERERERELTRTFPLWQITIWDKKFENVAKEKQEKTFSVKHLTFSKMKSYEDKKGNVFLLSTGNYKGFAEYEKVRDYVVDDEILAIPGGGECTIKYFAGKFVTSDNRLFKSKDKSIVSNKYLYYYLLNNIDVLKDFYQGSAIKHPNMSKFLNFLVAVPPLEIQNLIVSTLDKFTKIIQDFKEGLPAEIKLRKQQYQYYLNKILSF